MTTSSIKLNPAPNATYKKLVRFGGLPEAPEAPEVPDESDEPELLLKLGKGMIMRGLRVEIR